MFTRRTFALASALAGAALAARALRPSLQAPTQLPPLHDLIPNEVGAWRVARSPHVQVGLATPGDGPNRDQPYDDQVERLYRDGQGHELMLAVAYGAQQRQEVKIHRPELCYPAQGWQVLSLTSHRFSVARDTGQGIDGHRMLARNGAVDEAVSYWIRIGSTYSDSPWQTRWVIVLEGLAGRMSDGVLVRLSERLPRGSSPDEAYARQADFARQLVGQLTPAGRQVLAR
jgi:EpsI family protein